MPAAPAAAESSANPENGGPPAARSARWRHSSANARLHVGDTATAAHALPMTKKVTEKLWKRGDLDAFRFSPGAVLKRVKKHGDLFEPVLKLKQKLPR